MSIASKIQGTDVFHPDLYEPIEKVIRFDKNLKYVTFTIIQSEHKSTSNEREIHTTDAFKMMMGNSKCQRKPSLKSTEGPRFTGMTI